MASGIATDYPNTLSDLVISAKTLVAVGISMLSFQWNTERVPEPLQWASILAVKNQPQTRTVRVLRVVSSVN